MKRYWLLLLLFLLLSPLGASADTGHPHSLPFRPGERLIYELRWEFIPAGRAVLEVLPMTMMDGIPAYHFRVVATSNAFLDNFYKVRDRIDSYTDANMTHSLRYTKKQLEGRHRKDVKVVFDWRKGRAQYTNFGKKRDPIPLLPGTFDPLSVFYFFRFHHLRQHTELQSPVSAGKHCVMGKVRILTRQKIRVGHRSYDTFLVEPDLKDVHGVFEKSPNAKLQIWVTSDRRRIPVKLKTKVFIGSVIGELVTIEQK